MTFLDKMNKYALDFKNKCRVEDFDELNMLIIKLKPLLTKNIEFETNDTISNTFFIIHKATLSEKEKITYTTDTLFQIESNFYEKNYIQLLARSQSSFC